MVRRRRPPVTPHGTVRTTEPPHRSAGPPPERTRRTHAGRQGAVPPALRGGGGASATARNRPRRGTPAAGACAPSPCLQAPDPAFAVAADGRTQRCSVARSTSSLTGLARKSFIPEAKHAERSCDRTLAVSATIGTAPAAPPSARIALVAA